MLKSIPSIYLALVTIWFQYMESLSTYWCSSKQFPCNYLPQPLAGTNQKTHPLNLALDWVAPMVTANSCKELVCSQLSINWNEIVSMAKSIEGILVNVFVTQATTQTMGEGHFGAEPFRRRTFGHRFLIYFLSYEEKTMKQWFLECR